MLGPCRNALRRPFLELHRFDIVCILRSDIIIKLWYLVWQAPGAQLDLTAILNSLSNPTPAATRAAKVNAKTVANLLSLPLPCYFNLFMVCSGLTVEDLQRAMSNQQLSDATSSVAEAAPSQSSAPAPAATESQPSEEVRWKQV